MRGRCRWWPCVSSGPMFILPQRTASTDRAESKISNPAPCHIPQLPVAVFLVAVRVEKSKAAGCHFVAHMKIFMPLAPGGSLSVPRRGQVGQAAAG